MSHLKRALAFLLSFRRREWTLRDYPIMIRRQRTEHNRVARRDEQLHPWVAQIHGWLLIGTGETREDALNQLEESFEEYRRKHAVLPRPGTEVPLTFASADRMLAYEELAREFFPPILGVDYDDCFISDSSSIWDFPVPYSADDLTRKVLIVFSTDISDLANEGTIATILERITIQRRG